MTTNIEPTEEQREVAARYYAHGHEPFGYIAAWVKTGEGCIGDNVDSLASLLAEREHKLRADLDAARAEVEHFRKRLGETDVEACEARTELETARARIAELEAEQDDHVGCEGCGKRLPSLCAVSTEDPVYLCARCVSPMHMEREAAHLAHIKELRGALQEARPSVEAWVTGDGDDSDCDALQAIDEAIADTAHYDVEGGEG